MIEKEILSKKIDEAVIDVCIMSYIRGYKEAIATLSQTIPSEEDIKKVFLEKMEKDGDIK